jgi:hypothetical protein
MKTDLLKTSALFVLLLLLPPTASAQDKPHFDETDRVRLAEAFRLGDALGNQIWTGWNRAPFAVLLVRWDYEFLIRHPKPPADFQLLGNDVPLRSKIYFRKQTYQPNLLATFPIAGIPTIVIGQAQNTSRETSTPWVVTVLHEHFHQLQYTQPGYYDAVNALGLSRGDQSGMWMLNYPFPYDWHEMQELFAPLKLLLAEAIHATTRSDFGPRLAAYFKQRRELELTLSPDDYRYLSFQMWQEGIARYTEYRIAALAAKKYQPRRAFRALDDYKSFAAVANQIKGEMMVTLVTRQLVDEKRVMFYALGAGEGLLLDRVNPRWRQLYFTEKFYLDKYFPSAR